jgi:hypothetical protein
MRAPFRDELEAARARIAQLEDENARLREQNNEAPAPPRKRLDAQLFATLAGFLLIGGVGVAFAAAAVSHHADREATAAERYVEPTLPSYESVVVATIGHDPSGALRLTDDELVAPLGGDIVGSCGGTSARVRIAVRDGKAAGVSVYTTPRDPVVASCIDRAIRARAWPRTAALSTITTSL